MDLCSLGASTVVNAAGQYSLPQASCQRIVADDAPNEERGEDFGSMPIGMALGLTALPAPASPDGTCAEGIIEPDVGGFPGVVVAGWDSRAREVAGQMSPGDTCLHGTHTDATKRAKVFCKDDTLTLMVGNDLMFQLDRAANSVTLSAFGALFQITDTQTLITDPQGKAFIKIANGAIQLVGNIVMGNPAAGPSTPVFPVALGPTPGVVSTSVVATQ